MRRPLLIIACALAIVAGGAFACRQNAPPPIDYGLAPEAAPADRENRPAWIGKASGFYRDNDGCLFAYMRDARGWAIGARVTVEGQTLCDPSRANDPLPPKPFKPPQDAAAPASLQTNPAPLQPGEL